jgi:hypothetical protein
MVISILFLIALIGGVYLGAGAIYAQYPQVANLSETITSAFHFIVGNMKNFSQVFPVYDLAAAFAVVILVELIVLTIKIANWFIRMKTGVSKG